MKTLLTKMAAKHKRIVFNGNGYSAEWQAEAAARGLLNLRNTVDALPQIVTPECVALFEKYKILNERELHARYEIFLENYNKTINIEGQLMVLMANRYILPAALEYQKQIALSVGAVRAVGARERRRPRSCSPPTRGWSIGSRPAPTRWPRCSSTRAAAPKRTPPTCATRWCRPWRALREVGRRHRGAHAARTVAAADLPRDAVRQVGAQGDRRGSIPRRPVTSP